MSEMLAETALKDCRLHDDFYIFVIMTERFQAHLQSFGGKEIDALIADRI